MAKLYNTKKLKAMVKIINHDGVTRVESYLHVDQEFAEVLKNKANKKVIENMCKDLHVKHRLEEQNNEFTSVLGMQIDDEMSGGIVIDLHINHHEFLGTVAHFNENRIKDVDNANLDDRPEAKDEKVKDEEARHEEDTIDELPAVIQKLIGECAAIVVAIPKSE